MHGSNIGMNTPHCRIVSSSTLGIELPSKVQVPLLYAPRVNGYPTLRPTMMRRVKMEKTTMRRMRMMKRTRTKTRKTKTKTWKIRRIRGRSCHVGQRKSQSPKRRSVRRGRGGHISQLQKTPSERWQGTSSRRRTFGRRTRAGSRAGKSSRFVPRYV